MSGQPRHRCRDARLRASRIEGRVRVPHHLPCVGGLLWLVVLFGCTRSSTVPTALPSRHSLVREQLVIESDFELPRQHRLIEELVAQRTDLAVKLALPTSDEPIVVYLFDSAERFRRFFRTHYPSLPARRAFFVESDTRLAVYAHWGDRVAEDLRHEVCHGYLHAVVPRIPLWIDEGLAEYFEVPRGLAGFNRLHVEHLAALRRERDWKPDLQRLEALTDVGAMSQDDYAEAWAWVHWLLESDQQSADLLRGYLAELRQRGIAAPLSLALRREFPQAGELLLAHLDRLEAQRVGE